MIRRGRTAVSLIYCYASIGTAQSTKAGLQLDIALADPSDRLMSSEGVMPVEPGEFSRLKEEDEAVVGTRRLRSLERAWRRPESDILKPSQKIALLNNSSLYCIKGTFLGSQPRNETQHDPVLAVFTTLSCGLKRRLYPQSRRVSPTSIH